MVNGVKNVNIFGVDNSSSAHTANAKKDALVLDVGSTGGLDDTKIISEVKYSIIITKKEKRCLNLHYNGSI